MDILYASLHGNNNSRTKLESLVEIVVENKETIKDLKSLVNEGKLRFNLLKQELRDEKRTNASFSQYFENYKLENAKSINDACATNSTSCEASILKENVELRAQLELLTSNHRK